MPEESSKGGYKMLIAVGAGAGAVLGVFSLATFLGIDPLPYPKKQDFIDYQALVAKSIDAEKRRVDSVVIQIEQAMDDRKDLRIRTLLNEQNQLQNQIWQAEREARFYERNKQVVPDSIRREIEKNKARRNSINKDIDTLKSR